MKKIIILSTAPFVISFFLLSGCSGTYGKKIAKNAKIISIGEILKDPKNFKDKEVVIAGKISRECPSGCWFYLDDNSSEMKVELSGAGFAIPQRKGRKTLVMGKIYVDSDQVLILGSGVAIQ